MGKRIVIPFAINADPSSDRYHELWTVDKAKVVAKEIELHFENGAMDLLYASLYYGDMKVAPKTGEWTANGGRIVDYPDAVYYSGDKVILRVRNVDDTYSWALWGTIEFEVEE